MFFWLYDCSCIKLNLSNFRGKDYESHTKCITEEERYSAKGFQAKEKKGEKKQNTWVEMLQSVLDEQGNAHRNVLRIIETVSKFNNTPRKKPKFINFVKNVCGNKTNPKDIDQAWDLISVKLSALSANNQNKNQNQDPSDDNKTVSEENDDKSLNNSKSEEYQNEVTKVENVETEADQNGGVENGEVSKKKLSKKQRKEEKKRKKYEAEVQSAEAPVLEEDVEERNKKGKKKKNKSESSNGDLEEIQSGKNKNKRKRQDTANSVPDVQENQDVENTENVEPVTKARVSKKKPKVDEEELDESVCLHDQNVAKIEELSMNTEQKFNWHAVIISVLEKKGNELPFKRLQKRVLMEFTEATGQEVDDRIADKFIKKLRSAPNVRVDKNRVFILD